MGSAVDRGVVRGERAESEWREHQHRRNTPSPTTTRTIRGAFEERSSRTRELDATLRGMEQ